MKKTPIRTIIYGRSIIMAGLEASISKQESILILKRMENLSDLLLIDFDAVDLVLYDNTLPEVKDLSAILDNKEKILLIGVDLSNNRATLISRKESCINNYIDLASLIIEHAYS